MRALALVTVAWAVVACSDAPGTNAPPPATLDDVEIPEDFRYETNRSVALSVTASDDAVKSGAAVEVKREDGRRLYMGPILANKPIALDVVIPSKDARIEVTLKNGTTDRTSMISIASGEGSAKFE